MTGTLGRLVAFAGVPVRRVALSAALGVLAVGFGIGLLTTAGYLISRAAERPPILSLMVAVALVQAFGLARAFLRDAELVILDEPTANLDPASTAIVSEAIERLRVGRTVLLIVQRPELAAQADRILHLLDGRIVEPTAAAA